MAYDGDKYNLPLIAPGLGYSRNPLVVPPGIMENIRNCDIHQLGLGKRGGTFKFPSVGIFASGNGGFETGDFTGWTQNNSVLNSVLIDEDCSSLSGYSVVETPPDSTVDIVSGEFRIFSGVQDIEAKIQKDWGSIPTSYSFQIRMKTWSLHDLGPEISVDNVNSNRFHVYFRSFPAEKGIHIDDVNGNPILLSGSSSYVDSNYHTWKFNIIDGTSVDIYRDSILIYSNISCGETVGTDGTVILRAYQNTPAVSVGFTIDWYKILDPVRSGSYSSKLAVTGSATNGCISDVFTINPNIDYTINLFYFITAYTAGTVEIEMVFNDGSVTTVDILSATATTSGWTELCYTFGPNGTTNIPLDATTVTFQQKWTGTATGIFFIDDVSIPTSSERVTGLQQFISPDGTDRILRATVDGSLWNGLGSQIKTGLATRGDEILAEGDFQTHAKWNVTGDFDDTGGDLAYTHSTGAGTATQPKANLQIELKPSTQYEFTYTVSGITDTPACDITTGVASITTALNLAAGTNTTIFTTNSSPGNFVLDVTSTGTDAFTLDDLSLKEVVAYPVDISNYLKKAIFTNGRDVPQVYTGLRVLDIPASPIAGNAADGSGSVTDGKHSIIVTFINSNGETDGSPASIEIDVADNGEDGKIAVNNIPIGPPEVTGRSIYMTEAGGTVYYKVTSGAGATLGDNHTLIYTINLADGTLNTYNVLPTDNTATTGSTTTELGEAGIARPATALLATPTGGGGSINLSNGIYTYQVTNFNVFGETIGGPISTDKIIATADHDTMELTDIPKGPTGTISRGIYRTEDDATQHKMLTIIGDNTTTTYSDNIADANLGDNIPTSNTAAARPSDWIGTNNPKYAFEHSSGNTEGIIFFGCEKNLDKVYIIPDGTEDASDGNIKQFTFKTKSVRQKNVIVGGKEYGVNLLMFSQEFAWLIDKSSLDITNWIYVKVPWKGGTISNKTLVEVNNDIHSFEPNGNIYSIKRVQESGDISIASLTRPTVTRPYSINRWIKDNVDLTYSQDFHGTFNEELQAVLWFVVRKGQTQIDTALAYFVELDRWIIMDNRDYTSGFSASVSTIVANEDGTKTVFTGGYSGDLWKLNQTSKNDDSNGYRAGFKLHPLLLPEGDLISNRLYEKLFIIQEINTGVELQVEGFIDTVSTIQAAVASDTKYTNYKLGGRGREVAVEIYNEIANEDFFIMALVFYYKVLGAGPE